MVYSHSWREGLLGREQTPEAERKLATRMHNHSEDRGSSLQLEHRHIEAYLNQKQTDIEFQERVRGLRNEKPVQGLTDKGVRGRKGRVPYARCIS